jgi:hypothetical protein
VDIVTLDFETHWSKEYSLSKMSPLSYVRDKRFQLISCAVKVNDGPTVVHFGERAIRAALEAVDLSTKAVLSHNNSAFDSYVLTYHLSMRPRMWLCTLAMARPVHAKVRGLALSSLVQFYGLGIKDQAILHSTQGKRLEEFTEGELQQMAVYNAHDTDQCYRLYKELAPHFNAAELWHIDATIRMRTEARFALDEELLRESLDQERSNKHSALIALGDLMGFPLVPQESADEVFGPGLYVADAVVEDMRQTMASAPKFAALLEKRGVEVPTKVSPVNINKRIPALAKTDEEFLALREHEDPVVAQAAQVRLQIKSTLLETRIEKLLTAAKHADGLLPIPLRYCGADTTGRDSGEEYNPQNFPRINRKKPKISDSLRRSLRAPPGYKVLVADQSNIELRVNHFLWQVPSSMALYRNDPDNADLYKAFAARDLYKKTEAEIDEVERQVGKVAQLGLGFGAGAQTFQRVARVMGGVNMDIWEANRVKNAWRDAYWQIVQGWYTCHKALNVIHAGGDTRIDPWGLLHTSKEGIHLPSGRIIRYPGLRKDANPETGQPEWWYGFGRHQARIYSGKIDENIVQALARDSVFEAALRFYKLTGHRPALRVHDELVYVVPEQDAERLLEALLGVMKTPPSWWPELVVSSKASLARTYGDAK